MSDATPTVGEATALDRASQLGVLTARYAACQLGDPGTVLLLLVQAPLIGWLCTVVWSAIEQDTPALWFVMALTSVWFGCIGACREIVKERAILERERTFGISLWAYVGSKLVVLGAIGIAQVLMLQLAVEWRIAVQGPFLLQTAALWGALMCGIGLGLLVSAVAARQERAVGIVPLLLLPQILFSEIAIPKQFFSTAVQLAEKLMPVHWAWRVFTEGAAVQPGWLQIGLALLVLPAMTAALATLSVLALSRRREF